MKHSVTPSPARLTVPEMLRDIDLAKIAGCDVAIWSLCRLGEHAFLYERNLYYINMDIGIFVVTSAFL